MKRSGRTLLARVDALLLGMLAMLDAVRRHGATRRSPPRARRRVLRGFATSAGLLLGSMAVGLLLSAWLSGPSRPEPDGPLERIARADRGPTSFSPGAARTRKRSRFASVVARAEGRSIRVYRRPRSKRKPRRLQRRTVEGKAIPLVLLVKKRRPGWLKVRLPVRPNGSEGWVRLRDVDLALTAFRVKIDLRRHRLTVWRGGKVIERDRIATGGAVTPTPRGRYFITDLLKTPDPGGLYGPYAFGLSAFSPVLTSFAGGPGQIGVHGTDDPSVIGTDVSRGCIRVRNRTIRRLAKLLPLGTPVTIVGRSPTPAPPPAPPPAPVQSAPPPPAPITPPVQTTPPTGGSVPQAPPTGGSVPQAPPPAAGTG